MNRRQFLASALAAVGTGGLTAVAAETGWGEYHHPVFGRYVSHECARHEEWGDYPWSPGLRWVHFPVENILRVTFDGFVVAYTAFNSSKDLEQRIERMGPAELFGHEAEECLTFIDVASCVRDYYPEVPVRPLRRPAKYRLSSVWWKKGFCVATGPGGAILDDRKVLRGEL
jgi:hypothetical protein